MPICQPLHGVKPLFVPYHLRLCQVGMEKFRISASPIEEYEWGFLRTCALPTPYLGRFILGFRYEIRG